MRLERLSPIVTRDLSDRSEVVLIDLRTPSEFAARHVAGSLSVPFSQRGLGERVRTVLRPGSPAVLVAPDEATGQAAAAQLAEAGVLLRGMLEGGFAAWRDAGFPRSSLGEIAVDDLPRLGAGSTIVDVREPLEWTTGHVPGALLIPLGELRDSLHSIPRDRPVITICEAGIRSCTAASLLASAGFTKVAHVPAGSSGYRASRLPLAFPAAEVGTR
ncbi:MAG: rhodanese-like domain-containing protein [Candidatus Limnocylindria bacterium]